MTTKTPSTSDNPRCPTTADRQSSAQYHSVVAEVTTTERFDKKHHGRFYTHPAVCDNLVAELFSVFSPKGKAVSIADPFVGDGRLITTFLRKYSSRLKGKLITTYICDIDAHAVSIAAANIRSCATETNLDCKVVTLSGDAFIEFFPLEGKIDCCVTNPPWLILKPFKKTEFLSKEQEQQYLQSLEAYDAFIKRAFRQSVPSKKFGKWGTNLSRAGLELSLKLVKPNGACAIVSPASFVSDQVSLPLRELLFSSFNVSNIDYYVPEAKLFDKADVGAVTIVCKKSKPKKELVIRRFDAALGEQISRLSSEEINFINENGFIIPIAIPPEVLSVLRRISTFPQLGNHPSFPGLMMGRELDETRIQERLTNSGDHPFLKGFMVSRFLGTINPKSYVDPAKASIPPSASRTRIVWRDVSRTSQARRIIATIIPPSYVTGNSLGVAYFKQENQNALFALLGILSSFVFEFQVRSNLTTNHVSSGVLKEGRIPVLSKHQINTLSELVHRLLEKTTANKMSDATELECEVASLYNLSRQQFSMVLDGFPLDEAQKQKLLTNFGMVKGVEPNNARIPNHYAAKLSDLDMLILSHVPPGGNWKNIPETVPSQRLVQIRQSYKEGKGSRSTYYGRLRPDKPAYTINTYFSRPGNGCNAHYSQERTISQREAARFQSFPDSFVFLGSKGAIDNQIGNAVPPLLAFQIAKAIPLKGLFVDLFCGAGGLGLGFCWAGWTPVIANDIDEYAIQTHIANIKEEAFAGDITENATIERIVEAVQKARKHSPDLPLFILGGPPCQGFSTANCGRSSEDQRNWLFRSYIRVVELLKPDGFVFENVRGITNLEGGKFFQMIKGELTKSVEALEVHEVNSAHFGVPQRRERVIIIGGSSELVHDVSLTPITTAPPKKDIQTQDTLFPVLPMTPTAAEAISDLPPIAQGEDGSTLDYASPPASLYQRLMRGEISPSEYLSGISA